MALKIDIQSCTSSQRRRKGSNLSKLMLGRTSQIWVGIMLLFFTVTSCKSTQTSSKEKSMSEGQMATVVDYSGMDGCGKLLMLDDGQLILPLDGMEALEVCHFGQRVRINYEVKEAMASICMVEHFAASIQTLDIVGKESLSWMDQLVSAKSPMRIYRCFEPDSDFIYIQTGKKSTLYDIAGNEICFTPGKAMSDCVRRFNASRQCLIRQIL